MSGPATTGGTRSKAHSKKRSHFGLRGCLGSEGAAAAAGRLHVRVVELEPGAFEALHVIDFRAVEIQHSGLIHKNLQTTAVGIGLIQHSGSVFERHRIAETRAAATDYRDSETSRLG